MGGEKQKEELLAALETSGHLKGLEKEYLFLKNLIDNNTNDQPLPDLGEQRYDCDGI